MSDSSPSCSSSTDESTSPEWIAKGGFFVLVLVVIQMFWGMAFICEEYAIPSITAYCKRNKIPDDIAGAIYIGTGLSLPVLFVSFIGLFISNSAIGVGTVVGGDIFNHMINIAMSILASPDRTMKIDRLVTTREVFCYMLSCLLVIWAVREDLTGTLRNAFKREQWISCLDIPWFASFMLVLSYIIYVIMESYFDSILQWCRERLSRCVFMYQSPQSSRLLVSTSSALGDHGDLEENSEHDDEVEVSFTHRRRRTVPKNFPAPLDDSQIVRWTSNPYRVVGEDTHRSIESQSMDRQKIRNTAQLINQNDNDTVELVFPTTHNPHHIFSESSEVKQGYPEQSSFNSNRNDSSNRTIFYDDPNQEDNKLLNHFPLLLPLRSTDQFDFNCLPTSSVTWEKLYFCYNPQHRLLYCLDENNQTRILHQYQHQYAINLVDLHSYTVEDSQELEFSLSMNKNDEDQVRRVYSFRALDHRIFHALIKKFDYFQQFNLFQNSSIIDPSSIIDEVKAIRDQDQSYSKSETANDESVAARCFIRPKSLPLLIMYYFTLPLKYIFYFTIPDVRALGSEHKAIVSTLLGFLWLAILTYILVESLGLLAVYMNVNAIVMGYTVGAWAASYPALWSSVVVARNGLADIAVCNALGSNVFSNLIGLGLPWLIYSIAYGENYHGIQDQGAAYSVLVLMLVLAGFYLLMLSTNFVLYSWMIPLFVSVYIAYTTYFIYFTVHL
mmetsp:Transcript_25232/g.27541  ORF Transcript_25232/g.27541 Transcript_25232/m.27541 type:complete len:724 (+) Transcript_25232:247-2418(+)